jgi:RNA polymerase sigma-70 factor (ECF subfamily)
MDSTGKTALFLSVIETNKGLIYKVANAYCNHVEDRKDLVQEIITRLPRLPFGFSSI